MFVARVPPPPNDERAGAIQHSVYRRLCGAVSARIWTHDRAEGSFVGMKPGPHADGAALLAGLMTHLARPELVSIHEWSTDDLLVWANRCLICCHTV